MNAFIAAASAAARFGSIERAAIGPQASTRAFQSSTSFHNARFGQRTREAGGPRSVFEAVDVALEPPAKTRGVADGDG